MVFERPARPGANPNLTTPIADYMSNLAVPGGRVDITPDQVEVLRQTTIAGRPQVTPDGSAVASVAGCLALLHGVPPRGGQGLGLFLAFQANEAAPWRISTQQSLSLPEKPPKPFDALCVINPLIGLSVGVYVYEGPIAALRAELADGTVLAEDRISQRSLLVHLPVSAPDGWSEQEAPVFHLLDETGNDVVPPMPIPMRKHLRPGPSQDTRH